MKFEKLIIVSSIKIPNHPVQVNYFKHDVPESDHADHPSHIWDEADEPVATPPDTNWSLKPVVTVYTIDVPRNNNIVT